MLEQHPVIAYTGKIFDLEQFGAGHEDNQDKSACRLAKNLGKYNR